MSSPRLYNSLLDGDQFHADEVTVTGKPNQIPVRMNRDGIPFGGSESTALDAVNFIAIDYEAAARRNIGYIQDNIRRRKEREQREAEKPVK